MSTLICSNALHLQKIIYTKFLTSLDLGKHATAMTVIEN